MTKLTVRVAEEMTMAHPMFSEDHLAIWANVQRSCGRFLRNGNLRLVTGKGMCRSAKECPSCVLGPTSCKKDRRHPITSIARAWLKLWGRGLIRYNSPKVVLADAEMMVVMAQLLYAMQTRAQRNGAPVLDLRV